MKLYDWFNGMNLYDWFNLQIENTLSRCTVAVYYTLKYYMHDSLFSSKKAAVHCVLECYMHGSLCLSKKKCHALYFRISYAQQSVFL